MVNYTGLSDKMKLSKSKWCIGSFSRYCCSNCWYWLLQSGYGRLFLKIKIHAFWIMVSSYWTTHYPQILWNWMVSGFADFMCLIDESSMDLFATGPQAAPSVFYLYSSVSYLYIILNPTVIRVTCGFHAKMFNLRLWIQVNKKQNIQISLVMCPLLLPLCHI